MGAWGRVRAWCFLPTSPLLTRACVTLGLCVTALAIDPTCR